MAPNFYIDSPLDSEFLFQRMKDRLSTPGLLHEIRALDAIAKGAIQADRLFLIPLLVRKIRRTLEERYDALKTLDPASMAARAAATQLKADASELIWRTAWDSASSEHQPERRLASIHTAMAALATIDGWLAAITPSLPEPPADAQAC